MTLSRPRASNIQCIPGVNHKKQHQMCTLCQGASRWNCCYYGEEEGTQAHDLIIGLRHRRQPEGDLVVTVPFLRWVCALQNSLCLILLPCLCTPGGGTSEQRA
eukprot:1145503-Pelagomonas_calceolata.AAC.2